GGMYLGHLLVAEDKREGFWVIQLLFGLAIEGLFILVIMIIGASCMGPWEDYKKQSMQALSKK
ncbi:MAG: hypothetical protein ACMG6E_07730, partial [Candidatus Roizmanbacteria bacterium]